MKSTKKLAIQIQNSAEHIINKIPINLNDANIILNEFKSILLPGVFFKVDLNHPLESQLDSLHQHIHHYLNQNPLHSNKADTLIDDILNALPELKTTLMLDIKAIYNGDPAAKSYEEVLTYPTLEAIMVYRISNMLWHKKLYVLARVFTSIAHRNTGVDIHPGASIGQHFCIDHGVGVVIGETAIIGNHVKIYQGVTIGALSVSKKDANKKRHPTIEDHVTIYARTTILGGETTIGKNSIIGGNVWLLSSVPENSKIYHKDIQIEHSK